MEIKIETNVARYVRTDRLLFIYSPDFHIGGVDHFTVAVPHAEPWARAGRVQSVLELQRRQGAECEFSRPVDLDER